MPDQKKFWANWKTTAAAIVVVGIWALKAFGAVDVPTETASAITIIVASIGLFFAADA